MIIAGRSVFCHSLYSRTEKSSLRDLISVAGACPAEIHLTACGQIIKEELEALPMRFPTVRLEKYVIMPNHIHLLLMLRDERRGQAPTLH